MSANRAKFFEITSILERKHLFSEGKRHLYEGKHHFLSKTLFFVVWAKVVAFFWGGGGRAESSSLWVRSFPTPVDRILGIIKIAESYVIRHLI